MGYVPSAVARSLTSDATYTIGVIITAVNDPFMGQVMEGIEQVAHATAYDVFLGISHNNTQKEFAVAEALQRRRVDGLIVFSAHQSSTYEHFRDTLKIPIVVLNLQKDIEGIYAIGIDDYAASKLAVKHLIDLGHTEIGFVTAANQSVSTRRRYAGYRDQIEAHKLVPHQAIQSVDARHIRAGYESLDAILDAHLTAVFCYNDVTAIGLLSACYQRGIVVPNALSVVGFDDIEGAMYSSPPLTTVRQPKFELGLAATNLLISILDEHVADNILFDVDLVVRQSTAAITV